MAQKVITELVDDCDGTVAEETVTFGLDGTTYEIDLSTANAGRLRGDLSAFINSARKVGRLDKPTTVRASNGVRPRADREQTQAIRDWARRNNLAVKGRGRIPELVQLAFDKQDPSLAQA